MSELEADPTRNQGMDASKAALDGRRTTVTVDRDGIIHQWGDAVAELVGLSAEETLGRSLNIIIPPVLRPLHWWGFDRAMRRGRMSRGALTVPALCNDGRIVVAQATIALTPGKGGETGGAVVTFVGVGAPWQGRAWRAALAPINFVRRISKRTRANR